MNYFENYLRLIDNFAGRKCIASIAISRYLINQIYKNQSRRKYDNYQTGPDV